MPQRSFLRSQGRRAYLIAPALLLLLTQGCSPDDRRDPAAALALEFPRHARAVIAGGSGFDRDAARFLPRARDRFGFGRQLEVELPAIATEGLLLRGAHGFAARVREVGAEGEGRIVESAVAYPREGGTSYWTTVAGGVEEWIHLAPGRGPADRPAIVWQIEGAVVRQHGPAVEIAGEGGVARVRVTAPVAYGKDGRRVPVRLAAGGVSSIELFVDADGEAVLVDPIWIAAAPLSTPLYDHKDATLGNGKILVAGGTDGLAAATSAAMLYDPIADAWTDALPMNTPRRCHTATALGDGTALVTGGVDPLGTYIGDAESYDPGAGAWSYVPNMNYTHVNHAAVRLQDGTLLVTGGRSDNASGGGSNETPSSGPAFGNTFDCWSLGGGSGSGGAGTTGATERFDPQFPGNGWFLSSWMQRYRERHTLTVLDDGLVLAAGGEENGFVHDESEIYDPVGDFWVFGGWMNFQHEDHTATHLPDGTVLVAGGLDGNGVPQANAEYFVEGGGGSGSGGPGSWFITGPMNVPRAHHTASLLPDGTVLVAGGTDGASSLGSAEVYDPATESWTLVPPMATARSEHTATALPSGGILVAGGLDDQGLVTFGAEIYIWANPLGTPCEGGNECQSGFCADGVCCDADCTSTSCTACTAALKGSGIDGTCGPAAAGSNPHFDCFDDGVDTCGQTGVCDGLGACALYPSGSVCGAPFCQANFAHAADVCDGSGNCQPTTTTLCDPALCNPNTGACDPSCVFDGDCASGAFCSAGTCTPQKPNGQTAGGGNECKSGFAADGVCCDGPCAGACSACTAAKKGSGNDGACGAIKAGTDPDSECPSQAASTCGTSGTCDGAGACALHPAGTLCAAGSCVGSTAIQPRLCDGSGTCVPGGAVSCDPAGCAGGACLSGCTTDPDCVGSAYCNSGTCAPQKPLGQPATTPNQCLSGIMADGVCCNVPCTGTCQACTALLKGGGADGVCGAIKSGTDPDNECPSQATSTCGTSGVCDGAGACAFHAAGTVCASASCQGNKLVQPSLCDGSGTCQPQGSVSCNPGVCAGGTCQGGCTADTDCAATSYCAAGSCAPKKPAGQSATTPNQCLTGFVADGVCCDVACVGTCIACTAQKKGFGADGTCGSIQAGTDPDKECIDQGAASCGPSGSCNGSGACALYPSGTVCNAGSCQGSTLVQPSLCDGFGFCIGGVTSSCAPATCAGGTCLSGCKSDSDCVATAWCNAGTCAAKKPLGQPATTPNECLTGFLADGICCNTACTGTCVACTAAKKGAGADGTCAAIVAGNDPDDECAATPAASCGTTGSCDGQGACALHPNGTVCNPGSCQGMTLVSPDLCDGNGVCVVGGTIDCSPAMCTSGACANSCVIDDDCKSASSYCNGGTCAAKKGTGQPAKLGNECLTGFAADGVCCNAACQGGPCDACSVAAGATKDGVCAALDGAACDDGDACTQVDTCNGSVCTGAMPTTCPAPDQCHDAGLCNPTSGACADVPKPDGAACDDDNPCTADACKAGVCVGVSVLDNTPCPGGVCIAGTCVLDPNVATGSSSSGGGGSASTTSSAASTGAGGQGGAASQGGAGGQGGDVIDKTPRFTGGGCLSIAPAEAPATGGGVAAFFVALLGTLRRRSARQKPGAAERKQG
ncbi:MAG: kelch repeat-containing protein [Minicystis sp.]